MFYHPAVWWISRQIRTEREHCCDDLAAAWSGSPLSVAAALVAVKEQRLKGIPKEKKCEKALLKKRPLGCTCVMKSLIDALFVMLHRPFPVINSFLPAFRIFSSTSTLAPNSAALPAANTCRRRRMPTVREEIWRVQGGLTVIRKRLAAVRERLAAIHEEIPRIHCLITAFGSC